MIGWLVGWLVGFYGISTFVYYIMPNPVYTYKPDSMKKIEKESNPKVVNDLQVTF